MKTILATRGLELSVYVLGLTLLVIEPAMATGEVNLPTSGGWAGLAIIGALVVARIWRRG